ncbi:MAG: arylesterase [Lachnospiraceae bacterium]|nr:arylesterase [Lachnospiraceae bacterium]
MKRILAFGDSNTWGLIPGTKPFERYSEDIRWTGILQKKLPDAEIVEEGLCGRTTIFEDRLRPGRKGIDTLEEILADNHPLDLAIIMLGTNDCKSYYKASPDLIGRGIEKCLDIALDYLPPEKILLISPIHLGKDVWKDEKDPEFGKRSVRNSRELKRIYSEIASRRGVGFMAASDHASPSPVDDEHMDVISHRRFAEAVLSYIRAEVLSPFCVA